MPEGASLSLDKVSVTTLFVRDTATVPVVPVTTLTSLTDVSLSSPLTGQRLSYDIASGNWINVAPPTIAREVTTSVIVGTTAAPTSTGTGNVIVGGLAAAAFLGAPNNVAIGYNSSRNMTTGEKSVCLGYMGNGRAGATQTLAIGASAGGTPSGSSRCSYIGANSGQSSVSAATSIGSSAGSNTTFDNSTAAGFEAGRRKQTVAIGYRSLKSTGGDNTVAAGPNTTSSAAGSVILGMGASGRGTVIGRNASGAGGDNALALGSGCSITVQTGGFQLGATSAEIDCSSFSLVAAPGISSGAGGAVPANPTAYLLLAIGGVNYSLPLFT